MRSFARAAKAAPIIRDTIQNVLIASAKGAANSCKGSVEDVACRQGWLNSSTSEQATAADGNLGEVLNALQAVQGLLWPTVASEAGTINGTVGYTGPNATTSGSPSGTSGSVAQHTGAGAHLAASITSMLAVAFVVALSH